MISDPPPLYFTNVLFVLSFKSETVLSIKSQILHSPCFSSSSSSPLYGSDVGLGGQTGSVLPTPPSVYLCKRRSRANERGESYFQLRRASGGERGERVCHERDKLCVIDGRLLPLDEHIRPWSTWELSRHPQFFHHSHWFRLTLAHLGLPFTSFCNTFFDLVDYFKTVCSYLLVVSRWRLSNTCTMLIWFRPGF